MWRIGGHCPRRGAVSAHSPALGVGRVAGKGVTFPNNIHGDFEIFQIAFVTVACARLIAIRMLLEEKAAQRTSPR